MRTPVAPLPAEPITARISRKVRVARRGEDLGLLSIALIQRKVLAGELDVVDDHYFEPATNEWIPLGVLVDG